MRAYIINPIPYTLLFFGLWLEYAAAAPSLDIYGKLPAVSQVAISPSGEYFAFRRTFDNQDIILVYSIKQSKVIRQVDISKFDPTFLAFYSDNFLILGASQFSKLRNYRHKMNLSTAFSYNIKDNRIEALIQLGESIGHDKNIYLGQSGVGRILGVSADKKYLYMPAYVAEGPLDQSPDFSLLRVRIDGKGKPTVASKGNNHVIDYFLDDQGNTLVRESFNERGNIHKIEARQENKWKKVYEKETELRVRDFVGLTPDFKSLVYLAYDSSSDRNAYFTMRLTDGKTERLPYAREDADIVRVIHSNNRVVFGLEYSGFTPSYKFFEGEKQQQVDNILSTFDQHSVHLLDWSSNWENLVVKVEGSNYPGNFYFFPKNKQPLFITSAYQGLEKEDLNPIGIVKFKARDDRIIPTLVTIPIDKLNNMENLPAVILPHGGPAANDTISFDFLAQALASRGFLVIQPQFRGSTGFGYEHMWAGYGEWGKKMQDDITDTVLFFAKEGLIDSQRVCIAGMSYGGYAALAGAAFTPDLYQCAVSIAGVSHIPKLLSADKSRYGKDSTVMAYLKKAIGGGEFDNKLLRDISPYYQADKIKIPVLLIHGVDDIIVLYNQSKMMHSAIKKAKGNSKLVKLKKEDHYLQDSATRLQAIKETVGFIISHIGATPNSDANQN